MPRGYVEHDRLKVKNIQFVAYNPILINSSEPCIRIQRTFVEMWAEYMFGVNLQ